MMRRRLLVFAVANLAVIGFLVHLFWPLICLLFLKGEQDRIAVAEVGAANGDLVNKEQPQVVPKILHQVWLTCHVPDLLQGNCTGKPRPEKWEKAWTSVRTHNPDYEYKLWTDADAREFLEKEYSWFLPTWDSYPYHVQRADAIRYFALHYYGGIYVDLDDGCRRSLDPLLVFPVWVRRTLPTGIGNDIIGAVPRHPFIEMSMKSLQSYNIHWPSPYITIMFSTGPMFFSLMWRKYNLWSDDATDRIRLLFSDLYMESEESFFVHYEGNSWHQWDASAMFWMRAHVVELVILGFATAGVVIGGLWWLWNWMVKRRRLSTWRYSPIKEAEH